MASDYDGAFAQFVKVRRSEVFPVSEDTGLSDVQLGAIPCAFGTAESMLIKAGVKKGHRVLGKLHFSASINCQISQMDIF